MGKHQKGSASSATSKSKRRKLGFNNSSEEHRDTITNNRTAIISVAPSTPDDDNNKKKKFTHDEIVQHISTFLSSTGKSSLSSSSSSDNNAMSKSKGMEEATRLSSSISYLLDFLENNDSVSCNEKHADGSNDNDNDNIITQEDVATLLLPWSVACLMRRLSSGSNTDGCGAGAGDEDDDNELLAWRALSCCLDIILLQSSSRNSTDGNEVVNNDKGPSTHHHEVLLSTSLPQGTLNRLIPYSAKTSFASASTSTSATIYEYTSKCFVHLTKRYKPTLDNACSSLLHEVDSLVSSSIATTTTTKRNNSMASQQQQQQHQTNLILYATLQLIHTLLSKSNHKKMFTTICSILPCLGRLMMAGGNHHDNDNDNEAPNTTYLNVDELVKNVVWDGLFDITHHMEGFRSMSELQNVPVLLLKQVKEEGANNEQVANDIKSKAGEKKKKKICFQSNLFASVSSLLSPSAADDTDSNMEEDTTADKGVYDSIATVNILPILIRGFFERIRTARRGSTSSSEGDANIQFRFFCHVMAPVFEHLFKVQSNEVDGDLSLALLNTVSKTLGLVLDYDAYLPSYSDPDGKHLAFLESITTGLLQKINGEDLFTDEQYSDQKIQVNILLITSLRHILLLNHRLLHERLDYVLYFACTCLTTSRGKSSPANELICAIVKIYRELRQVGYFLTSARGAFSYNSTEIRSNFMLEVLNNGNIMESLSVAYQTCPSGQVHEIWNFFDHWIVDIVDQKFADDINNDSAIAELRFVVQMYIIFLKNIRANKHNSHELRSSCQKSVASSVSKLLGTNSTSSSPNISTDFGDSAGILMRQGFDLWGWLVDLHTRSCFWLSSVDINDHSTFLLTQKSGDIESNNSLNVFTYLHNVVETAVSSKMCQTWRASFLESYWEKIGGRKSKADKLIDDIGIPQSLRGTLQRLAVQRIHQLHSMIYYSNLQENDRHANNPKDGHTSSQVLVAEAKKLVDFTFFIACSQLASQSSTHIDTDASNESLWLPLAQSLCIWSHYCDFFHAELFMIWFFNALCVNECPDELPAQVFLLEKTVARTLARDVSFYDAGKIMSKMVKIGLQFAFSQFLQVPGMRTIMESSGYTKYCVELVRKGHCSANLSLGKNIESIGLALSFLASAPIEIALSNDNLGLLDIAVGLDVASSHVIKQSRDARGDNISPMLTIVHSTRSIIANLLIPKTLLQSSDFDNPCLTSLTSHLLKSYHFGSDSDISLVSCDTVTAYFALCIDYYEMNPTMLKRSLSQLRSFFDSDNIDFSSNNVLLLLRSVIRKMNILNRHHSLSKRTGSAINNSSPYELCLKFVLDISSKDKIVLQGINENDIEAANTVLLESEMLAFIGNHLEATSETDLIKIKASKERVQILFELVTSALGSQCSSQFTNASSYFLSTMASCPGYFLECVPPFALHTSILDLLADVQESPLLETAFCSLIRCSSLEEIQAITAYLLEKSSENSTRSSSTFITKIFYMLISCANNQEQHKFISGTCRKFLLISVGLLRDRSRVGSTNVELFARAITTLVSKKELLLLSGREIAMICCELNPLFYKDRAKDYGEEEGMLIFHSCCSVVASLVSHYPKQLYGCPSPLFSLLLALLSNVLQTSVKKQLSQKALELAK